MIPTGILKLVSFLPVEAKVYDFADAEFSTVADPNGDALYSLSVASNLLYVQATDPNTFSQVTGAVLRYRIEQLTINYDTATVSGRVVLDVAEDVPETFVPTNGVDCAVGAVSGQNRAGRSPSEALYPSLGTGFFTGVVGLEAERLGSLNTGGNGNPPVIIAPTLSKSYGVNEPIPVTLPTGYTFEGAYYNGQFYTAPDAVYAAGNLVFKEIPTPIDTNLKVRAV